MKKTKKQARQGKKTKKSGVQRVVKVAGVPGLYRRKTSAGMRYQLKLQIDGKTKYKILDIDPAKSTLADVIKAAEEARQLILHPVKTFEDYIADYATAKALKPHSIQALKQALRGFGLDDSANQKAAAELQTSSYSPSTIRAYMQRASAFYDWMRRTGVVIDNPCDGRKLPKASEKEAKQATAADAEKLIALIDEIGDADDRLFVRLLRYTGARCSTIAVITPKDFDEAENGAFYAHLVNVKCARPYKVQMLITDAETCDMIRQRLNKKVFWAATEQNLHMRLYKRMRRLFGDGITPHSLRHLFASELLQKGVALDVISKLLDHSDISITLKTYARHNQNQLDNAVRVLSSSPAFGG